MTLTDDRQAVAWAQEFIEQTWNYRAARLVQVVHGLGVFKQLGHASADAEHLAAAEGLDAAVLEKMLIACAAMDMVRRDGNRWALTDRGRAILLPDSPLYQGDGLSHGDGVWGFWNDLEHIARGEQGASIFTPGAERPRDHHDFICAMHNFTMAGRGDELAERVDLTGRRLLLDVGGGPGTYAIAFCRRYPQLRAVIFDLAPTIEIAREVIERFGMSARIDTVVGDWNDPSYGNDYDAVLTSNILHGPTSDTPAKLSKAHRAMSSGGVLIIQDFVLNRDKTGPLKPALFNVMVGAFAVDELTDHINAAGFVDIDVCAMPDDLATTLLTARRP